MYFLNFVSLPWLDDINEIYNPTYFMSIFKKVLVGSSLLAVTACGSPAVRLSGAGASFPSKIYTRWFSDYARSGGTKVNYQAVGSGSGRKAFIDETVNFGASDDPMKDSDIKKVCDLKLTQEKAVQVAMGMIKDWKQLGCKPGKLTWTHRSDGSGTTKAFTNSMEAFSKTWNLGTGKSVKWPSGVGAKGNSGVAGVIQNTPGAIGYVNQSYIKGDVRAAALQNRSGQFIVPSSESGAIALNGIRLDENLAGINPNPKAKGAYPIATLTWILAYETGNGRNTEAIKDTFYTLLSDEYQSKAPALGFVPLEGEILQKSINAVGRIGR